MIHRSDLRVLSVDAGTAAKNSGMKRGDVVVSVNGRPISDEFDFRFNAACEVSRVTVRRAGEQKLLVLRRAPNAMLGVHFVQRPLSRCANRCVFCFIDQMPKGLRKSLYVKDEDLGHSFTNGNYVTLSATSYEELERVAGIGLSPLFISVHATDNTVRRRMLGNRCAFDVMDQLRYLAKNDVSFHTQIVVCPGYNDRKVLRQSVRDLLSLSSGLLSIAIVPVGLTQFRRLPLSPVTGPDARAIMTTVSALGDADKRKHGSRRVFCADELFIKAGRSMPPTAYYEDYPQIENGVGLVRQLLDEWRIVRRTLMPSRSVLRQRLQRFETRILLITSHSAAGYLDRIAKHINRLKPGVIVETCPVENEFFGRRVTVAGLLTGRDIIRTVRRRKGRRDRIMVPAVTFNYRGFTLDGWSAKRLEKELGTPLSVIGSLDTLVSLL